MRRLGILAAVALLSACAANQPASCAPCPGPGYVASGLPAVVDHGRVRICVRDACTRAPITHPIEPKSQEFVDLPAEGSWQDYDGAPVTVTVISDGRRWQGTGDFTYTDGGPGPCTCSYLVAEIGFTPVG